MKNLIKFVLNTFLNHCLFLVLLLCCQITTAQSEEKCTVLVSLHQPVSASETQILEEILMSQITLFLNETSSWNGNKLEFEHSSKKMLSLLNKIVKEDVNFHDYEALKDFKGFSNTAKKKIENISKSAVYASSYSSMSESQTKEIIKTNQLEELLSIIKTELYVFGEKDILETKTEVFTDLTQEEKDNLLKEIDEFQDGDMLEGIKLEYETINAVDNSEMFGDTENDSEDLADKILNLLAENAQRLERLESELAQLVATSDEGSPTSTAQNGSEVLAKLPESLTYYFQTGSSRLSSIAVLELNEIVEVLAKSSSIKIIITGYADNSGTESTNLYLSKKRAQAVKRFLEESGISTERILINYFGESKNERFNNEDRRVEINFFV